MLMIAPAVIVIALMMVFPVLFTAYISLHDWSASTMNAPAWVGLRNYTQLIFTDSRFQLATLRTFYFTIVATGLELILGTALALLFVRHFRGRGVMRTLFLLPMVATPVAMALIWTMILDPTAGVANWALKLVGLPPGTWLNSASTALPTLMLIDIWQWTPLVMLMVIAGLSTLPGEPFEASAIDGATPWQTFWLITLPMLRPYLMVALLFRAIDALKTYDIIFATTQGGPGFASETLNLYAYSQAFTYFQLGYASAMLIVFFALLLGVAVLLIRFRRTSW